MSAVAPAHPHAQSHPAANSPLVPAPVSRAKIREAFDANPSQMTVMLARQLGVPEVEVIRAMPADKVDELDITQWEQLLRAFEQLGNVHVITTNSAVTLEAFGTFGNFSLTGPFFNVQTKSLDMHIRHGALKAVFAVQKPGHMDGVNTLSFQFFDERGSAAFKVFLTFGGDAPPAEKVEQFLAIRDKFKLA
jgi:putative hemin transport protein